MGDERMLFKKDNRSLGKRKVMHQIKNKRPQKAGGGQTTTASSTPPLRGVADVADSSDERFVQSERRGWKGVPAQKERNYELDLLDELDDVQTAQMNAADFSMMSQMPLSVGGHFKFSSEKNWDAATDVDGMELLNNTEASEYFTLNLKLLNAGLRTIPFHKRMDYSASMFTNDELGKMEQEAEIAEKEYKHIQAGTDITNPLINIIRESSSAKSSRTNATNAVVDGTNSAVNEIVEATEKVELNDDAAVSTTNPQTMNSDIQEWLDNVLEDGN